MSSHVEHTQTEGLLPWVSPAPLLSAIHATSWVLFRPFLPPALPLKSRFTVTQACICVKAARTTKALGHEGRGQALIKASKFLKMTPGEKEVKSTSLDAMTEKYTTILSLLHRALFKGEMEPVSSWRPFTEAASKSRYLATKDMQPMLGGLPPTAVTDEILQVAPGERESEEWV